MKNKQKTKPKADFMDIVPFIDYSDFRETTENGNLIIRFHLNKPIDDETKRRFNKYSNISYGTYQYKYAPEIKGNTLVICW